MEQKLLPYHILIGNILDVPLASRRFMNSARWYLFHPAIMCTRRLFLFFHNVSRLFRADFAEAGWCRANYFEYIAYGRQSFFLIHDKALLTRYNINICIFINICKYSFIIIDNKRYIIEWFECICWSRSAYPDVGEAGVG